jgi:hypothetical protein
MKEFLGGIGFVSGLYLLIVSGVMGSIGAANVFYPTSYSACDSNLATLAELKQMGCKLPKVSKESK